MAPDGWNQAPPTTQRPPYGGPPPNAGFGAAPPQGGAPRNNGKAIASLVLGIAGCCTFWLYGIGLLPGIVGIVLGIMANKEIKRSNGSQAGGGMAVAGIVLGSIAVAASLIVLFVMIIAFSAFQACFQDPESVECKELTGETESAAWSAPPLQAMPLLFAARASSKRALPGFTAS